MCNKVKTLLDNVNFGLVYLEKNSTERMEMSSLRGLGVQIQPVAGQIQKVHQSEEYIFLCTYFVDFVDETGPHCSLQIYAPADKGKAPYTLIVFRIYEPIKTPGTAHFTVGLL